MGRNILRTFPEGGGFHNIAPKAGNYWNMFPEGKIMSRTFPSRGELFQEHFPQEGSYFFEYIPQGGH